MTAAPEARIELDLSDSWQPPDDTPGAFRLPRWLPAVLAVVLLLAGLPPMTRHRADWAAPLLTLGGTTGELKVGGDLLYVLDQPVGGRNGLRAYDLGGPAGQTAQALWRAEIDGGIWAWRVDGDVSIVTHDATSDRDTADPVTAAVDGHTGAVRWRTPGFRVVALLADVAVLRQYRPGDETLGGPAPSLELRAVDRLTGVTAWSRQVSSETTWVEQRDPVTQQPTGQVVEFDGDGTIRVIDPRTGTQRSATRIGHVEHITGLSFRGDLLIVDQITADGPVTFGYEATTGRLVWSAVSRGSAMSCGAYVCRQDFQDRMLIVSDPVTGAERWRRPNGDLVTLAGDRLIVWYARSAELAGTHVIDLAGGRTLQSFPRWQIVDTAVGGTALVAQNRGGLFTLGLADLDRGGVIVLARTDGWFSSANCQVTGSYVGCYGGSTIAVWRLPSGASGRSGTSARGA